MDKDNSPRLKIPFRQKVILIIFGLCFSLILLEVVLRLGGFVYLSLQEHKNRASSFKKGTYRIMCLGESTTALGGKYSYPSQLEYVLNKVNIKIKFSVINKGFIGANTSRILEELENNLNIYKPDMVVTMMGMNDGSIKYYEGISDVDSVLFKRFKTYKWIRILWTHVINKIRKKGISEKNENKNDKKLPEDNLVIEEKESRNSKIDSTQTKKRGEKVIELSRSVDIAYVGLGFSYISKGENNQAVRMF
jgi:lysophospholipase L1-like esterase